LRENIVAIVGRPNVGKSALFNRIAGRRIAIVAEEEGVTRDRIYAGCSWGGRFFNLVDTGGLELGGHQERTKVRCQVEVAISEASSIVMVTDVTSGVTTLDEEVAGLLRKSFKPVVVAVNKCDNETLSHDASSFFALGFSSAHPVSAIHGLGVGDLLDDVVSHLEEKEETDVEEPLRIAVIGRPNVGKSTFINVLLGEERVIVDEVPGTTRDSVDTPFSMEGRKYLLIDTAGIRHERKISGAVERYSLIRSRRSIGACDVALVMVDARTPLTTEEMRILSLVVKSGRGLVIAANKWDLVEDAAPAAFIKRMMEEAPFAAFAPAVTISALKGWNVEEAISLADRVRVNMERRISTGLLNRFVRGWVETHPPPLKRGKRPKIYFAVQVKVSPPLFVLFVNDPRRFSGSYESFILNNIRRAFDYEGVPLGLKLRKHR